MNHGKKYRTFAAVLTARIRGEISGLQFLRTAAGVVQIFASGCDLPIYESTTGLVAGEALLLLGIEEEI